MEKGKPVIKSESVEAFVKEFNANKPSDEFFGTCKKAGELIRIKRQTEESQEEVPGELVRLSQETIYRVEQIKFVHDICGDWEYTEKLLRYCSALDIDPVNYMLCIESATYGTGKGNQMKKVDKATKLNRIESIANRVFILAFVLLLLSPILVVWWGIVGLKIAISWVCVVGVLGFLTAVTKKAVEEIRKEV